MNHVAIVVFALALAGCASPTLPIDYSKMTEEQLRAVVNDRSVSVSCGVVDTLLYGRATTVFAQIDRSAIYSGGVTVDSDCQITISAEPKMVLPK